MKKVIISLFFISSLYAASFSDNINMTFKDKKEAIGYMDIVYGDTFKVDGGQMGLFGHRFYENKNGKTIDRWNNWRMTFDGVSKFIRKAAGSDKDLLIPLSLTIDADNQMMNAMKFLYTGKIDVSDKEKLAKNKNIYSIIASAYTNSSDSLTKAKKALTKASFFLPSKKDARDVLNKLIDTELELNKLFYSNIVMLSK